MMTLLTGHEVIDGGFQLFVTHPDGVEVPDPVSGQPKHYPFQTNLVYSWLSIHIRSAGEDCGMDVPPPEWIIIRYQVCRLCASFQIVLTFQSIKGLITNKRKRPKLFFS